MISGIISVLAFWLFFFFVCPIVGGAFMGDGFSYEGLPDKLGDSIIGFLIILFTVALSFYFTRLGLGYE